ncbi:hypothetical protein ACFC14_16500 [Microbacterium sp. NPDC055988]|uniref:hypothetical protein n=1 Tax=Microbacterium sp. NPDC055988 TaxID=3345671 RepID=UPI0035E0530D
MISPIPSPRSFARTAALTSALLLLVGCTPDPPPSPTPTPAFASEEEAFAAAEASFDRYTRALNGIDTSNPETFEALFDLSSGSVEKADRENFSSMHAEGQSIEGETRILSFSGLRSDVPLRSVTAAVCLDVGNVSVVNPDGTSAVNPNRPDVYALEVTFQATQAGTLLVDSATPTDEFECPAS